MRWWGITNLSQSDRSPAVRLRRKSQRQAGLLEQRLQLAEELGGLRAVDGAVVAGQGHGHQLAGDEAAVLDDRLLLDRTDREDRGLRRVEDGREDLDAVHAEVRDRERSAVEVVLRELALARALDDLLPFSGDLDERLPLDLALDRDDEAALSGDR